MIKIIVDISNATESEIVELNKLIPFGSQKFHFDKNNIEVDFFTKQDAEIVNANMSIGLRSDIKDLESMSKEDRFECDFIDERVTLSEPENEIVDEIMKIFNEEKQKLELIKNISLEELKTKLNIQYKEKDDYIDILKDDLIYSVFTKKENENNSFYCYPANQEYIFNLIPSCLPNEKFKFFILTDLIRLIPIIISEESIKVKNQLEKQIPDETQLAYLINKYFVRTLEYQRYVLQDSYLNNLVKQDLAVLFNIDNLDERKRFDLIRQIILKTNSFYFIEENEIDIEAFNKYIKD